MQAKRRQAKTEGTRDNWKELVRGPSGRLEEKRTADPIKKKNPVTSLLVQENLDRMAMRKRAADKKWGKRAR